MKGGVAAALGAALALALLGGTRAEAAGDPPLPPEKPAGVVTPAKPTAPPDGLPPYEDEVERLATRMGTLAYMRDLCGAGDGAQWRGKMEELLASEGSTAERRDRLAGAFNAGLQGYAATYRRCTPAAGVVIERALADTARLSHDLATRFAE